MAADRLFDDPDVGPARVGVAHVPEELLEDALAPWSVCFDLGVELHAEEPRSTSSIAATGASGSKP